MCALPVVLRNAAVTTACVKLSPGGSKRSMWIYQQITTTPGRFCNGRCCRKWLPLHDGRSRLQEFACTCTSITAWSELWDSLPAQVESFSEICSQTMISTTCSGNRDYEVRGCVTFQEQWMRGHRVMMHVIKWLRSSQCSSSYRKKHLNRIQRQEIQIWKW